MIKSLSPYYVSTPWVNPEGGAVLGESYTILILVWNGSLISPPVPDNTNSYTKTQENPAELIDSDKLNIARLISDFIEFAPQKTTTTSIIDSNNTWWVRTSIVYANDATVQQEIIDTFSLGYSYGNEGENITTITNNILLTTQDYKVNRTGVFVMPVLAGVPNTDIINFVSRVEDDGGIAEAIDCIGSLNAGYVNYPSGYKAGKIYNQVGIDGVDDSTVVRASVSTRINEAGLIESMANNVLAPDYIDGGCPVWKIQAQSTNLYEDSELNNVEATTVTATPYTVFLYGTGTIDFTGAFVGSLVGTGANDKVELTFTPSAGTLTSTDSGSVDKKQLENEGYSSSYIFTSGGTATRLKDVVTGSGDSNSFNDTEGVWVIEASAFIGDATNRRMSIGDGTADEYLEFRYSNTANQVVATLAAGGVLKNTTFNMPDSTVLSQFIITYELNKLQIWVDGDMKNENLDVPNMPTGLDTMSYERSNGGQTFEGNIALNEYYLTRAKAEIDYPFLIE